MEKPDLTYRRDGLFAQILPETAAGETAWRELAKHTDGTGKVLSVHLETTLAQLRTAGYVVSRAKKVTTTISDADWLSLGFRGG